MCPFLIWATRPPRWNLAERPKSFARLNVLPLLVLLGHRLTCAACWAAVPSELKVPRPERFIFGVGGIHHLPTPAGRLRLLAHAFEVGFRAFDVAPAYGNGLGEVELGRALVGRRHQCEITTKFGIPVDLYGERHPSLFWLVRASKKMLARGYGSEYRRRDFSRESMTSSLDGSLRRLRTDHVDRLLIHEPLEPMAPELVDDLLAEAAGLKAAGKIRAFGVAGEVAPITQLMGRPGIEVVQTPLRDAVDSPTTPSARRVAYGVYAAYLARPTQPAMTFTEFVEQTLQSDERLQLIVASRSPRTVATLGALLQ